MRWSRWRPLVLRGKMVPGPGPTGRVFCLPGEEVEVSARVSTALGDPLAGARVELEEFLDAGGEEPAAPAVSPASETGPEGFVVFTRRAPEAGRLRWRARAKVRVRRE